MSDALDARRSTLDARRSTLDAWMMSDTWPTVWAAERTMSDALGTLGARMGRGLATGGMMSGIA